jgi:thiol-disulfide isomerase/thioredoxin
MNKSRNFEIKPCGEISNEFLGRGISTFQAACQFIASLPYGRNLDKTDLKTIFSDHCGTCSTKHALLKTLAQENELEGITLVLGIFKMNAQNTPAIAETLKKYNLEFLPEAHTYLKFDNEIMDFTKSTSSASDFEKNLLLEVAITPNQISNYKVAFHKAFLKQWILENPAVEYDLDALWRIREQCIQDLSN